jgi:hypothetical protein
LNTSLDYLINKSSMNKKLYLLFIPLLYCFKGFSQSQQPACNKVKEGTFFYYPPNTQEKFIFIRESKTQKEIETNANDTTVWKIDWINACAFTLSFLSKNRSVDADERSFYNSHKLYVNVLGVTDKYYTFKSGLDSVSTKSQIDTIWLKRK